MYLASHLLPVDPAYDSNTRALSGMMHVGIALHFFFFGICIVMR